VGNKGGKRGTVFKLHRATVTNHLGRKLHNQPSNLQIRTRLLRNGRFRTWGGGLKKRFVLKNGTMSDEKKGQGLVSPQKGEFPSGGVDPNEGGSNRLHWEDTKTGETRRLRGWGAKRQNLTS